MFDQLINKIQLRNVPMDGGNGLNIIYESIIQRMEFLKLVINASNVTFDCVVRGIKAKPVGQLSMEAIFGDEYHFCMGTLFLEVADFESAYHAIVGCPTDAK